MSIDPKIFRAYDIRGIVGKDFEPSDAHDVGKAFGTYLDRQPAAGKKVIIGHDNRFSSDELNAYLTEGLLATDCQVIDLGLSLTPLVHYAVLMYQADGGVMITGSHNPKEFNGFRFQLRNGAPLYGEDLQEIWRLIKQQDYVVGEGAVEYDDGNLFEKYLLDIKGRLAIQRPLKVVLDCGNGTASAFATRLFKALNCEVISIYCNLHGDYPYHQPDPSQRITMQDLKEKVLESQADLGIAFDTDGDRFGIVDEQGQGYDSDKNLIPLARDVLKHHPGTKVMFDVKSSYVLADEIRQAGGVPVMNRTGHPYFREALLQDDQIFLAGELSGHTFIRDNYYGFDDGLYAAARLLEVLSKVNGPYSEFFRDVEQTAHTGEIKAPCPDERKFAIVKDLKEKVSQRWEIIDIDGVRIKYNEKSWALVRASNTSPNLTLRFEADSPENLRELIEIITSRLENYPVVDLTQLYEVREDLAK